MQIRQAMASHFNFDVWYLCFATDTSKSYLTFGTFSDMCPITFSQHFFADSVHAMLLRKIKSVVPPRGTY